LSPPPAPILLPHFIKLIFFLTKNIKGPHSVSDPIRIGSAFDGRLYPDPYSEFGYGYPGGLKRANKEGKNASKGR
jgi:hypothetical protein